MEKTESQDKLFSEFKPPSKSKIKEFFSLFLKLVIGMLLLPVVYSASVCFSRQLMQLEPLVRNSFIGGIVGFLGAYLFVWEPAIVYKKGQKIVEVLVKFFAPLVKVAPFVLPIYTILIFSAYLLLEVFMDIPEYMPAFIFSAGFSLALHLVFSAKTLRSKQGDSLKSSYIFGFSWICILDAVIVALFLNSAFEKFSFLAFFNGSCQMSKDIYTTIFRQLFL